MGNDVTRNSGIRHPPLAGAPETDDAYPEEDEIYLRCGDGPLG